MEKPRRFVVTCYELVNRPSYRSTGNNFHEVEWLVGPIPEDGSGTEVVMSYGPKQGFPGKEFCIYLRSFSLCNCKKCLQPSVYNLAYTTLFLHRIEDKNLQAVFELNRAI